MRILLAIAIRLQIDLTDDDAIEKLLTIGVVVKTFKNGFRVKNAGGWYYKGSEPTFFYKDGVVVVDA